MKQHYYLKNIARLFLLVQVSLSVTYAIVWSYRTHNLLLVSIASLSTWIGFLIAHYLETGKLVDRLNSETPKAETKHLLLVLGLAMMVFAFPIAIWGVYLDSPLIIFGGELTFFSGFSIGHYGLDGKLR